MQIKVPRLIEIMKEKNYLTEYGQFNLENHEAVEWAKSEGLDWKFGFLDDNDLKTKEEIIEMFYGMDYAYSSPRPNIGTLYRNR